MTKEEAVEILNLDLDILGQYGDGTAEAYKMAIKALEQQPCIEDYPTCTECEHYDSEKHYCPRFCQVIKDTLAEAQTCENINEDYADCDQFKCSECQIELQDWHRVERDDDGEVSYHEYTFRYCPHCGRRIKYDG